MEVYTTMLTIHNAMLSGLAGVTIIRGGTALNCVAALAATVYLC